ncbi:YceI family protein [Arcanobacterium phocisimile]|uniref:YceI family protein n=1 Tax=Arcanobacterium phocisimile TaxID=1302235 RepID=A0ABX7IJC4_9ACTO|nr:YceI family protein [Arcanobacterium phocisimile]QRV02835.1 YceI family protein [Arcanobacterium phocisimile]
MTALKDLNGKFIIDAAHSRLGFVARHAMVTKVRGNFGEFEGYAEGDASAPENGVVDVTIKADSINTGNEMRDNHLRSDDFFGSDTYPTITFRSTDIKVVDEETVEITGDFTIRGTTKSITIPFEFGGAITDHEGKLRIGFEGATDISRKDFGITWNGALEAGGVMVSDKIKLELELALVKEA